MGISVRDFDRMKERLGGSPRVANPVLESGLRSRAAAQAVILGIDPSLRGTGYGVIRAAGGELQALVHGTISCPPAWERSRCLVKIGRTLRDVLHRYQPTVCVVEGIFYAQNLQTAMVMGEARGATLAVMAEAGLDIYEIATRKVKQAIVGYGAAQKLAVAKMVQRMLDLRELPAPDAADALALALTYAQEQGRFTLRNPKKI